MSAQTSPPIGLLATAALGLAILSMPACDRPASGPHHPVDQLDYPVAVTADPSKKLVWVVSGNFDLAWRGGAILAIDVVDHSFVKAETEDGLVPVGAEIGSFPGPMELLVRDGRAVAGYVLSRTESALFQIQLSGDPGAPVVDCPGGKRAESGLMVCPAESAIDEQPITNQAQEADTLDLGIDPYGAMVHDIGEADRSLLLTGGMVDGNVALFELDAVGTPTGLAELDITGGLLDFVANPLTGRIYASHKHSNAISVLALAPPNSADDGGILRLEKLGTIPLPANVLSIDHGRGMALSPDGRRLYAAYRAPSSVLVIDVSDQASAEPSERVLAKIPVHSRPSDVVVAPAGHGLPELVYAAERETELCFLLLLGWSR